MSKVTGELSTSCKQNVSITSASTHLRLAGSSFDLSSCAKEYRFLSLLEFACLVQLEYKLLLTGTEYSTNFLGTKPENPAIMNQVLSTKMENI